MNQMKGRFEERNRCSQPRNSICRASRMGRTGSVCSESSLRGDWVRAKAGEVGKGQTLRVCRPCEVFWAGFSEQRAPIERFDMARDQGEGYSHDAPAFFKERPPTV